ncbi:uncharacterized protein LOC135709317 [Ochlerotatus camptorhynchus]|uniref:uncharacterized protein LOC135709317 n=1 Tax=Ochlerotatus camptorhynchus TaxID=644619 RepID=UPI0031D26259
MADNERQLSQFLYHVTQEIVTSGDFSDCNINRICGKYYENSSYPDRDRLRQLVSELKRKLQIYQFNARSSNHGQSINTDKFHRCSCQHSRDHYNPYPPEEKTTADKCVATMTDSNRDFFPARLLVSDSTQYSQPHSVQTFSTVTECSNSTCTVCGSCRNLQEPQSTKHSPRSSSEDSNTLIEQLLLKHAALDGDTSSEILMRLAAGDRVLCESCHGKCPLHRCGQLRGDADPGSPPPICPGRCDCGPTCGLTGYPERKKNCECPLQQCRHLGEGSGGAGGGSKNAPILRQEPPESQTPPVTCCGTSKTKRSRRPANDKLW